MHVYTYISVVYIIIYIYTYNICPINHSYFHKWLIIFTLHIINNIYGKANDKPSKSLPALPEMCWEDFERLVLRYRSGWVFHDDAGTGECRNHSSMFNNPFSFHFVSFHLRLIWNHLHFSIHWVSHMFMSFHLLMGSNKERERDGIISKMNTIDVIHVCSFI